jgi:chemotaxis protein CheZ
LSIEELSHSAQEIPDAVRRLTSVIGRLEQFAHASLDELERLIQQAKADENAVEETLRLVEECSKDLDELAHSRPELAPALTETRDLLRQDVEAPLQRVRSRLAEDNQDFLSLIGNMSFQDLTGQTLKKVIEFIERLQSQLMGLIARHQRKSTAPEQTQQPVPPEGPEPRERAPLAQESVDKMLADLGF